ncbi:MAG: hypothetical protein FWF19_01100 [Euryarchaeota archaeon]|nr:hypothetical protein [Euryarchaeota archaeon]
MDKLPALSAGQVAQFCMATKHILNQISIVANLKNAEKNSFTFFSWEADSLWISLVEKRGQ